MSTRPATTSTKPVPLVYVATAPLVLITDTFGATHHVYDGEPLPEQRCTRRGRTPARARLRRGRLDPLGPTPSPLGTQTVPYTASRAEHPETS